MLLHHGYFIEDGGFGSHTYLNNEFSDVLRTDGDGTMIDAVGLAFVFSS